MYVNLSSFSLFQVEKFLDPVFSRYNVIQVTFVSPFLIESSFLTDLYAHLKNICQLMLIQDFGDVYAKCTCVISCSTYDFNKSLDKVVKLLVDKFGKEVYFYV